MISVAKIFGKAKPAALTLTTLFTVAVGKQAEASLYVANQGSANDTVRIALTGSGQVLGASDYIAYDVTIPQGSMLNLTAIGLGTGDFVTVRSTNGYCSFVATGLEVTP